jgi:glycosyltransferase involved in cell wall biosynthesis
LAVAIAGLGWNVTVATPVGSAAWRDLVDRPGVSLVPFTARRTPHPSDLIWLLRLLSMVRRYDVVHAHSSKAGFLGRLACLLTRRRSRCVFTPHGWSFWSATGSRRGLYLALERLAAPWGARVVSVSAYERDAALAAGVGRAAQYAVVPNGVHVERFAVEPAPRAGTVVMVARLAPPKRADLVVRAVALLHQRGVDVRLQLVGGGPLLPQVASVVAECRAAAYVDLLGDRDDVPALLACAGCFVLASDYEGCPLSVLEAMAAGVPVVVTRVGGIDEVVTPATGVVVGPTAAELAEAIESVFADPVAARAMGEAGRASARERFTTERMAGDIARIYAAL